MERDAAVKQHRRVGPPEFLAQPSFYPSQVDLVDAARADFNGDGLEICEDRVKRASFRSCSMRSRPLGEVAVALASLAPIVSKLPALISTEMGSRTRSTKLADLWLTRSG